MEPWSLRAEVLWAHGPKSDLDQSHSTDWNTSQIQFCSLSFYQWKRHFLFCNHGALGFKIMNNQLNKSVLLLECFLTGEWCACTSFFENDASWKTKVMIVPSCHPTKLAQTLPNVVEEFSWANRCTVLMLWRSGKFVDSSYTYHLRRGDMLCSCESFTSIDGLLKI